MAITGLDASRHQGTINWNQVAGAGHGFAFIKATDGVSYRFVDWYHTNIGPIKATGMVPGAYHFLLDHHPGDAQARYYVQEVNRSGGFAGVVPIVDIEREADGTTPRIEHLRAFVKEFRRMIPNRPILIYTGRWYWVGVIGNPFGADLGPLWHSEYDGISPIDFDVANGPELDNYGGWTDCLVWQHTSSGTCPGVVGRADLNLFYGDRNALLALAGTRPPQPPIQEDEDMPYLHASNFTGIHVIDGVATWLSSADSVGSWASQVKVITDNANEQDARRFIEHRSPGALEAFANATHEDLVAVETAIRETLGALP